MFSIHVYYLLEQIATHIALYCISEGHVELIKKWKIDDKLFYDETRGFTAACEMVQSKNYMTIIGGPGSGKTASARHIALQLEKQGWEVVPVCKLEDIIEYGDRDHKQVFVLDDVLGIFAVEMNTMFTHKEIIFTTIGQTSKLLFTCRKSLYKEVSKLKAIVTENVIDLESEVNQLTETEKMAICQHHCKCKGVNQNLYASLSFTNANHMFPFLCKIFSQDEKYQQLGESFFNKPYKYFINELGKLQDTHTIQYAVLVLCLLNEGKLSVEHLPPEHMQKEVFNNCGVNLATPDKKIKDAIYHMSETYFTQVETEYTFTHDFIFEAIAYHYGCQNKHTILKYLSSSYIANKVTVYHQASNEDLCIHISEDMYLPLAERLYTDIQSMNLFDVFMNKSLKHGPFRDVFETMLKAKPIDKFESLILRKRDDIHDFVAATLSANMPTQQMIDVIEYGRLFLLFYVEVHVRSGLKYIVEVISWIINYGHTHLLQEIVNHVECNNLSISLVFGSHNIEKTRLLLLGCHSKTLDMVELILTYIDPKCIDIDCTSRRLYLSNDTLFNRNGTPLTTACAIGSLCIVKALLKNHADINKCNRSSESPLFIGSSHGHMDIVKCLVSSGADINLRNKEGRSPLFVASQRGHCAIVKCLLSSGADINLRNKQGRSPLFEASYFGRYDVVKCLLSSGADINLRNKRGQSQLFAASKRGHCDVVKCLLSSGADINLRDEGGQSPLFVATFAGYYDIVRLIEAHGALRKEIVEDSNAFLNTCGYPEEEIRHSIEKREEEKEAIYLPKVQEGKEETMHTREQEEKKK
jgi:ankyrin repeat protein